MRSPVNGSPKITNNHGTPGWGYFGKHAGIDYSLTVGTPIYAPDSGTILSARNTTDGGLILEIRIGKHDHRFLHLSRFARKSGKVKKGELIAYSGNTGVTTGPHLHWDVRKAGTVWNASYANYVDPLKLITKEKKEMVTLTGLNVIYRFLLGVPTTDYGKKNYLGKVTFDEAYQGVKNSPTYRKKVEKAKKSKEVDLNQLPQDIRNALLK